MGDSKAMNQTKRSLNVRVWRGVRITILTLLVLVLLGALAVLGINQYVKSQAQSYFLTKEEAKDFQADYLVVLGASVLRGGTLSDILQFRVDRAIELFQDGAASSIVMSGDSAVPSNYDEVTYMKRYAVKAGVPAEQILSDEMGISTYDSMRNMAEQYPGKKIVVVTQRYHLYRAVYIARQLGLDAYGVAAEDVAFQQETRDNREFLARVKDFWQTIFAKM